MLSEVLKVIEGLDASAVVSIDIAYTSGMESAVVAAMGKHTRAAITQSQGRGVDLPRAHVHLKIRPDVDAWMVTVVTDRAKNSSSIHAYPVITQRRRAPKRQAPCRTHGYVSVSAS